ncbi:MAG: HAD family phosphatase [Phycisphaerales bacterium]|nr:HAD family phosphatase [Phycisphaerales bacterium]
MKYPAIARYEQPLKYQLLAIDLDRTLLDRSGRVAPETRAALHLAHESGLRIVLCTGRSYTETRPVIDEIGLDLDAAITVGGALLTDVRTGKTLSATHMNDALAAETLTWFRDRDHTVLWLSDRAHLGFDGWVVAGRIRHVAIDRWLAKSPIEMRECDAMPAADHAALRVTIIDETPALEELAISFGADFTGRAAFNLIHVPAYEFSVIEAFDGRVNKWFGVRQLCERWGIDAARVAAIGDDVNDFDLIRGAALGAAVENAVSALKEIASIIMPAHDQGGAAAFIQHVLRENASE